MSREDDRGNRSVRVPVIAWILAVACLLRVTAVVVRFENLQVDRDVYLSIAQNLLEGNGFCSTPGQPTAYRPPLYPLFVAACTYAGGIAVLGLVQILIGTATVWLTWHLAGRCQFSKLTAAIAATLVAIDPLLIEYTTQAMTETLSTFLVTILLVATLWNGNSLAKSVVVGVLFGLAALCRPSIWAFGAIAGTVWVIGNWRSLLGGEESGSQVSSKHTKVGVGCILAVAITISPWVIRNASVFGRPILMTTHGGYTLLLGNNETFFNEVVADDAPWSAVSLSNWQSENERHLSAIGIATTDEVLRDAELSRMAKQWILSNPLKFVQSCSLRVQRFWACRPSVSVGVPTWLILGVRAYYLATFSMAAIGFIGLRGIWFKHWSLPVMVVTLTLVHSVYWSNARMRSAIVPVIALAAAAAFQRSTYLENSSSSIE
ncbi:MAG: glycosyltransferase family 39 protein [Planctomycetota bacterium]|nr:glycosyltransferase family 39 protein [Planctomycetota bacterium]MDA0921512.1 glycosyltransferase family 39 protein [Planctomycetota bacterium]MDA1160206.1 glycosyltransferase family 39 protein [Planctomycetota bacterium]